MGLFSSDSTDANVSDEKIDELVESARSDSVTKNRLGNVEPRGKLSRGFKLSEKALVDYLSEDERPHFIFFTSSSVNGIEFPDLDANYSSPSRSYSAVCITSDRIILAVRWGTGPDKVASIPLQSIRSVDIMYVDGLGIDAHQIVLTIDDINVRKNISEAFEIETDDQDATLSIAIRVSNAFDTDDLEDVAEYLNQMTPDNSQEDIELVEDDSAGLTSSIDEGNNVVEEEDIAEDSADYVTPERVEKVVDVLEDDEKVIYLTRGSTIDVEGSSAGNSLFGDDRSRKSGTTGYVRTAITDKRVFVKIPQLLGDDERTIPYRNITTVDLDTGLVNKRLSLHTAGQTYHIEAHEPNKEEVREATKFIREKIAEKQGDPSQGTDEPDTTDKLRELKELHKDGIISEEEFESKKADLLDEL